MTGLRKHVGLACLLALVAGQVLAGSQLKLYPIRGMFVVPPAQGGALIHSEFQGSVDNASGGAYFEAEFRKAFPDAVSTVAEKDKRYTLVSSLQIARASYYGVDKVDGTSDVFIPDSGSVYFTNAVSGEVLYTVSAAPNILRQVFTDVLGAEAPVSVVHVNALFANVLMTAFSRTNLSSENSGKRELPDFFIRLSVPESRSFEMPSALRNTTVRSYRTIATAELVDRSGRVPYAASGEDRIDDKVVAGMGFDETSRLEVSVKNALLSLAKRIGTELKFERLELPLQSLAPLSVKDQNGMLAQGEKLTVFRSIGRVDGIEGEVRVKQWRHCAKWQGLRDV